MSDPIIVVAAVLAPVLLWITVMLTAASGSRPARQLFGGAELASALVGLAAGVLLAGTSDVGRLLAVAGAAAAGGAIVAGLVRCSGGAVGARVVAGIVAALSVALIATLQLAVAPPVLERVLGAFDLGGALPRVVAPAAVALGFLAVWRRRSSDASARNDAPRRIRAIVPIAAVIVATLAVAAGAIASERSAETAPSILLGALVGAVLGAVSWMLVVRIAGRPAHPVDPVSGALVGSAAVLLVLPALVPVAVAATAVAAGLAGGALRGSGAPLRGALAGLIVGIAAGGVVVGLLADGIGFAATGGLGQVVGQVMAVALATGVAASGGAIVGAGTRLAARRGVSTAPANPPRNDNSPGEPGL